MSNILNIDSAQNIFIGGPPIGSLCPFAGINIPEDYLLCDGSAISRVTYSKLFNVIGTLYGSGDDETTFNLPDFRDKVIWGGDIESLGTVKSAGLPNITGSIQCPYSATTMYGGEWYASAITQSGALSTTSQRNDKSITESSYSGGNVLQTLDLDASQSDSIYGNSNTVQPPAITILILIKYR